MFKAPKNHSWIETLDGSLTLFSERFQEACHSTAGAREETLIHYLKGCRVEEKILQTSLNILEVGFGLGLGFMTTLETIQDAKNDFHFLSLEIDHELVGWVVENLMKKNLLSSLSSTPNIISAKFPKGSLTILLGDARQSLPAYLENHPLSFDVIYQDAFSPKKNPTLWTVEWFELLKKHSHQDVTLSTYSASDSVRKSMVEAGWKLQAGEKFGTKRASTRATITGSTDTEILLHLGRCPTPAMTDKNIEMK